MIRSEIEKLEVPKMIVWVDKEMKVETTHLTEKTVDEIMVLITKSNQELLSRVERELQKTCDECDGKGYTETGGMAMEDDLVEREPCESCDQTKATIDRIRGEL